MSKESTQAGTIKERNSCNKTVDPGVFPSHEVVVEFIHQLPPDLY